MYFFSLCLFAPKIQHAWKFAIVWFFLILPVSIYSHFYWLCKMCLYFFLNTQLRYLWWSSIIQAIVIWRGLNQKPLDFETCWDLEMFSPLIQSQNRRSPLERNVLKFLQPCPAALGCRPSSSWSVRAPDKLKSHSVQLWFGLCQLAYLICNDVCLVLSRCVKWGYLLLLLETKDCNREDLNLHLKVQCAVLRFRSFYTN